MGDDEDDEHDEGDGVRRLLLHPTDLLVELAPPVVVIMVVVVVVVVVDVGLFGFDDTIKLFIICN